MKVIRRRMLSKRIILGAGDEMTLTYVEIDGVVRNVKETTIAKMIPYRGTLVDEALIVEGEFEGRYMIGTMLLEAK